MAKRIGRIELPFTDGFYLSRSKPQSSKICINWQPNDNTQATLSGSNLYASPGLSEVLDGLDGIGRGSHSFNGVLYTVNGEKLYRIDRTVNPDGGESYSPVEVADIPGSGRVIFASTAGQLVIVEPDIRAYVYDGATLTDLYGVANVMTPIRDVIQINSFFLFCQTGTNWLFHSALNDGKTYAALDRWQVTQIPETIGLINFRGQAYVMGEYSTVPFVGRASNQFAFQVIPNGIIDCGLAGTHAKTLFRGSFVFLGSGENAEQQVWLMSGAYPQTISTEPLDYLIQNESRESIQTSFMMRHSQDGAEFLCFRIGDYCFVYDLVVGRWHERRSRIPFGDDFLDTPWRVNSITQIYNKVFVTDSADSILGVIDDLSATEYGINLHRKVRTQPFMNMGIRQRVWAIEAYFDVGYSDEENLQLRWSDDGGFTWSNWISRPLGAVGEYGRRIVFDRLGAFPNTRMLEFVYTGINPASFNKLLANVT
jgi:hypothetical protein